MNAVQATKSVSMSSSQVRITTSSGKTAGGTAAASAADSSNCQRLER